MEGEVSVSLLNIELLTCCWQTSWQEWRSRDVL